MLLSNNLTKKQKIYLNYSIKIAIVGFAFLFIYQKINNQQNLLQFKRLLADLDPLTLKIMLTSVIVLMFVNWFLEVWKWVFLSRKIQTISFWLATKSVFSGLTWAIFTPNRIGEYGGRVMLLKPKNRAKGAVAMGVGLFAQLVLTSVAGSLSIAWFIYRYLEPPTTVAFGIWVLAFIYALGFLLLYFNVRWIDSLVGKFKFLKRIKPFFSILEEFSMTELCKVLMLSFARFLIFTSQYIILMKIILPSLPFVPMVLMVFILFFVQSALPSLDLFDFSVRSFVASNLYSYITDQEIAVMAIVSCIWFVNLILPAILGSVFVLKTNYIGGNDS